MPAPQRRAAPDSRDLGAAHRAVSATVLFTAYVLLLLMLTIPALWAGLLALPAGRIPRRLLRAWARFVIRASGCRLRVSGVERLRRCGPAMLVANHASYLDSVVLLAALPLEYRFVANQGLTRVAVVGTAVRKARYLTVDRSAMTARRACLLAMIDMLRHGTSLLVFPEAGIARTVGLLPFRLGAFRAAVEIGRPVVSIAILGTRDILPYRGWMLRRGTIDVAIHEPIEPIGRTRQEVVRLRDRARHEIAASLECL